ncbi:uncharacterized protein LOC125940784 [Dermacentor silvarum]|uniref:uncharacterized protein LOC125940784 n=1 Tax=Dermacentor silvarum TaxID=543639 RepID=UPI002101A6E9|nr:uncharacterized protein LOC125940784 [Dermacentor silvarum]
MSGLKVITVTSGCEAFAWNRSDVLEFGNAVKSYVSTTVALCLTAAIWDSDVQDKEQQKTCSVWQDNTEWFVKCAVNDPDFEHCKEESTVLVDNRAITAMVTYAKSNDINAFVISSAHRLLDTLPMHRNFHLFNFALPVRQGVSAKDKPRRSIRLREPRYHNWSSSESGRKMVTAEWSAGSEAEQVETKDIVVAAEHPAKSGVAKTSSKPADSATNKPVSAWRWRSSSSPTAATEGSKHSPRQGAKKPIKEASAPSSDMTPSAPSVNDEGAT